MRREDREGGKGRVEVGVGRNKEGERVEKREGKWQDEIGRGREEKREREKQVRVRVRVRVGSCEWKKWEKVRNGKRSRGVGRGGENVGRGGYE